MPPAKSGIADYSAALVEALHRHADVAVHEKAGPASGIGLYQIGNNGHHAFVYEEALRNHGVAMLNNELRWFEHNGKRIGVLFLNYNYMVRTDTLAASVRTM